MGSEGSSRKKWEELASVVWERSGRRLFLSMPYLAVALNRMPLVPDGRIVFTATDGENIYYNPMLFVQRYKENPIYVNRAYMHMILHCMFLAPFKDARELVEAAFAAVGGSCDDAGLLFDLAADIYAEYLIDGMDVEALRMPESDIRSGIYKDLKSKCGVLSIENILRALADMDPGKAAEWEMLFRVDDHCFWHGRGNDEKKSEEEESKDDDRGKDGTGTSEEDAQKKWEETARSLGTAIAVYGNGRGDNRLLKSLEGERKRKISYRDFLKKFMKIREMRRIDVDSFDYGYYNYGMNVYGDMPLIEEPEMKEDKQLGELFIAIDTSGSCSGGLIEKFLDETLEILTIRGMFYGSEGIRLLLCDNEIRGDYLLKPGEDLKSIKDRISVNGFGGTDFRPVFRYMRRLREKGGARRINGLLYFTDGYGIYPRERPGWKTAFIFAKEPDFDGDEGMIRKMGAGGRELLRPPAWALTAVL